MASITRRTDRVTMPFSTDERILAAVVRLLDAGERYTEISVQRILVESGISRATFYAHFRDKTDLIVRLTSDVRRRSLEIARSWDPGAGEEGADRYARFFADVIALHREKTPVLAALREVAGYDPTVRDFYTADLEGFDEAVLRTLLIKSGPESLPPTWTPLRRAG
jgi:AcrR family transcriptional regulator